jgi:putative ABC transport system substrate-binding protein
MRRRDFITLLGGAMAAWPLTARAQQAAMPVVGFLHSQSRELFVELVPRFRQGLKDAGYVEGENVTIEYRWAENRTDRLPEILSELVRRPVAAIAAMDTAAALAAKATIAAIPVVFIVGGDPVSHGLVASLARPGGNLTGINFFPTELVAKRLELLREIVPAATRVAVLVSPAHAEITESTLKDAEAAARAMNMQIQVLAANTSHEIDLAFATLVRARPDALLVAPGPFFTGHRVQLAKLAAQHAVPTIYSQRMSAEAGGLISYGASVAEAWHQAGAYLGGVLKGARPAELPVVQPTKFELVINLKTAKALGLEVPPTLLARADEVIE